MYFEKQPAISVTAGRRANISWISATLFGRECICNFWNRLQSPNVLPNHQRLYLRNRWRREKIKLLIFESPWRRVYLIHMQLQKLSCWSQQQNYCRGSFKKRYITIYMHNTLSKRSQYSTPHARYGDVYTCVHTIMCSINKTLWNNICCKASELLSHFTANCVLLHKAW